jgi:Phage portal protein, SPP1 Gp6-like
MAISTLAPPASTANKFEPFTPVWWATRLHERLEERRAENEVYRRYADGDHDNPHIEEKASRAFRRIMGLAKTNLSGLIIEAAAERMAVQGFRFGDDPNDDDEAWAIWQGSDFDGESELLITESLTVGRSFVLVEPPGPGEKRPRLYGEDADQMILAYAAGRRTDRMAGWKEWVDEWTGQTFGTLYLPDRIIKLQSSRPLNSYDISLPMYWTFRDERMESEPNPLGEVPVWEIPNRPRMQPGEVRSEIFDVIVDQDACNHIALNALIAAEYGAFRQKWMTGLSIPRDPVTGAAIEPFDVAVNRMLISENEEARFGDFNPTALGPYIELYESRVKHMAAVSRTPVAMLLGGMVNVSAEALALSVAGLVQKVKRKFRYTEQPFESALRAAFKMMGDDRAEAENAETVWVDPEVRSSAQQADAAVKLVAGEVITAQTAQELYLGMSAPQRTRDQAWRDSNSPMLQLADRMAGQEASGLPAGPDVSDEPLLSPGQLIRGPIPRQ